MKKTLELFLKIVFMTLPVLQVSGVEAGPAACVSIIKRIRDLNETLKLIEPSHLSEAVEAWLGFQEAWYRAEGRLDVSEFQLSANSIDEAILWIESSIGKKESELSGNDYDGLEKIRIVQRNLVRLGSSRSYIEITRLLDLATIALDHGNPTGTYTLDQMRMMEANKRWSIHPDYYAKGVDPMRPGLQLPFHIVWSAFGNTSLTQFSSMTAFPIYLEGRSEKPLWADRTFIYPWDFWEHDLAHNFNIRRTEGAQQNRTWQSAQHEAEDLDEILRLHSSKRTWTDDAEIDLKFVLEMLEFDINRRIFVKTFYPHLYEAQDAVIFWMFHEALVGRPSPGNMADALGGVFKEYTIREVVRRSTDTDMGLREAKDVAEAVHQLKVFVDSYRKNDAPFEIVLRTDRLKIRLVEPSVFGRNFEILLKDGILIGGIGIAESDENGKTSLPVWIDQEYQNQGYALEAKRAVVDFLFGINFREIEDVVRSDNLGSIRLHERLGFLPVSERNGIITFRLAREWR